MRFKKNIPLLVVVLLLASFCACTWGDGESISTDILRSMPLDSTSLAYWKINTLGTDEALEDIYNKFKDSDEVRQLREIGVRRSDIEQSGRASGFGQATITVFTVKMDIEDIKSELDKREDYEREDYELVRNQETSIWIPHDSEANKSIAVRGSMVLMGNRDDVIECVDVIALDQELSLNDDGDIISLVDRLPDGVLVYINKDGSDPEEDYRDLILYGKSYAKQGSKGLKLTAVYMFEDFFAAMDAQDSIITYLSDNGFSEPEVEVFDDVYLRATTVINTTDFANFLDW